MRKEVEARLIENAGRFRQLAGERLPAGLDAAGVLALLDERAQQTRAIMEDNNRLIDTWLAPVFRQPASLSDDEADELYAFALRLYQPQPSVDIGLALPLHEALLERARQRGDVDRTIIHLHWIGCILCLWGRDAFGREAYDCFRWPPTRRGTPR